MANAFEAGLCRYSATIEQQSETQDATGAPVKMWSTFCQAWVSIEGLGGNERVIANQLFAGANVRIRMRFVEGIKPSMRVTYSTRHFDIADVSDPDGRRRELVLTCIERTESGS